jgi:Fic family protein
MNRDRLAEPIRQRLKRLPAPHDAHYGVVPITPPEGAISLSQPTLDRLREAETELLRLETVAEELCDPYLISRILPRREAVSSSSIEGTNSTLDELLSIEEGEDERTTDAAKQVRDYALTLDQLIPRARAEGPSIFTVELVKELHRKVMRGDTNYEDTPGDLRRRVVWIGGRDIAYSTYNPAPPEDVLSSLEQTMTYMRSEGTQEMHQSLITRMSIAHSHFEAVHPFRDGNGRVGRLLLPLMMAAEKRLPLYLSPYIEAHKEQYHASLRAAQQQLEWSAAIEFNADAVVGSIRELLATRQALRTLQGFWRDKHRFRGKSAARLALDILPHYPVITIGRLATLLGITFGAAARGMSQLVNAGIVEERTGYRRNRIFAAREPLSIINRPFGEHPRMPGEAS